MKFITEHVSPLTDLVTRKGAPAILALAEQPAAWTVMLLVSVINVVLYILVLNWTIAVLKDKKCTCAHDWRLKYAAIFPPVSLAVALFTAYLTARGIDSGNILGLASIMMMLLFAGWVLFVYIAYSYVNDLVKKNCTCATTNMMGDEALQVYTSIQVAWWVIAAVGAISVTYIAVKK